MRPWHLMWRVIARRQASIWRAVTRAGSIAFRPKAPKLRSVPPLATPLMRPLKALRNLVRFGCNISRHSRISPDGRPDGPGQAPSGHEPRSEEHTSELQSLMRISYAVICLKKKNYIPTKHIYDDDITS